MPLFLKRNCKFFRSLNNGKLWWYNIIEDNKVSISHILRRDTITAGYILLTIDLVAPKWENSDRILTVKIIEWSKLFDCFAFSIEADPSRVGKNNVYFPHIMYITSPSNVKLYIDLRMSRGGRTA